MVALNVALGEGFDGDSVVVEVNGSRVFERDGVSTRTQIGLAESFEVPVDEDVAVLEIRVISRGAVGRIECPIADRPYVDISLEGDDVVFKTSKEPFGYL
jgi:hypothetical protein